MTDILHILSAAPGMTVQDKGRPHQTALGISRGGAADALALLEANALLGPDPARAVIEITGAGGKVQATCPTRFALTGATAKARIDDRPVAPYVTHVLKPGQTLTIGPVITGVYTYLALAGGLNVPRIMGGCGTHLLAGLGQPLTTGDELPIGPDPAPDTPPLRLDPDRASKAPIRVMPGAQTHLFPRDVLDRFQETRFQRSPRGNRQGVRMDHAGEGFATRDQLALVSDFISEGDVQMTGDGRPFVLLSEHQTTGGYPRIGTVIPADLPRVAQAMPGDALRFQMIDLATANGLWTPPEETLKRLTPRTGPMVRDPKDIADLMSLNLIDGVTMGDDETP